MFAEFRRRFWLPPRAHGDVIEDRTVSFLELFYDLVYVVVIAQAAHTLAEDITWRTAGEFAVIFALIWFGWLNGTLYQDLHGHEDGRSRTYVFAQMLLLALLAVFTSHAADDTGEEFALVYTIFLALLTWLWYTVRRQDSDEWAPITARYLAAMGGSTVVVFASVFLSPTARMWVWAIFMVSWVLFTVIMWRRVDDRYGLGTDPTDSLIERFGLFVIIVLGEVVVGVVDGISSAENLDVRTVATGMIGLLIGFAFWWSYFDFLGRRKPRIGSGRLSRWMLGHLPITMAIAGSGAAMVSLVEHAADARTPAPTAWLLAGGVALGMLTLVAVMKLLEDFSELPEVYAPLAGSIGLSAVLVLAVGQWRPVPWLFGLAIWILLSVVWFYAAVRWIRSSDTADA